MCNASLLWKSIHTLEAIFHDVPVLNFLSKAVCEDEVLGKQVNRDAKGLVVQKLCAEVKIFHISSKPMRYGGRDGTINEDYGLSNI